MKNPEKNKVFEITNGNTQVKYINIRIGSVKFSFSYFEAFKIIAKSIIGIYLFIQWFLPIYNNVSTTYTNVQKIPNIKASVDTIKAKQEEGILFDNAMRKIHKNELNGLEERKE